MSSIQDYLTYDSMARAEMASLVRQGKANYSTSHIVYLVRRKTEDQASSNSLVFADLACSEKIRKSVYLGEKLLETVEKTSNLVYFSKCINYLLENKRSQISRHEDCLVDLLYEGLGGNSLSCYIVSVSLREEDKDLTFNTLEFGQKVSSIENMIPGDSRISSPNPVSVSRDNDVYSSHHKHHSSKLDINPVPLWLEKCNDILKENGSELKRLQTRNFDLETQVVKLEKMLRMSHVEYSSEIRDSPDKNLSFFSVDNDLHLNNILLEEEALPTNPRVSFSKQIEGLELFAHSPPREQEVCRECRRSKVEIVELRSKLEEENKVHIQTIESLQAEISRLQSELASKSCALQNLATINASIEKEKALASDITKEIEGKWKTKVEQLTNNKKDLETLNLQQKQREDRLQKELVQFQNLRYELQSQLQQTQTQLKMGLQNEKLAQETVLKFQIDNNELKKQLQEAHWKYDCLATENEQLRAVNKSQQEKHDEVLTKLKIIEKERALANFSLDVSGNKGIVKQSKDLTAGGKTISQLRLELKSNVKTSRLIDLSENKENDSSILNGFNSYIQSSQGLGEELEYISLPINFRTSVTVHPSQRFTQDRLTVDQQEGNCTKKSLLDRLDAMKAVTPLKKSSTELANQMDYNRDLSAASQNNYYSASLAKATAKKREISELLDILSNCQEMIEGNLRSEHIQETDIDYRKMRLDLIKLWKEMEECLKADEQLPYASSHLDFIQELLMKLFTLINFLMTSRDKIASSHREIFREKVDLKRLARSQAKFLNDLHLDEDLIAQKREKFIRERRAVATISKYYRIHRRELETSKLKRAHKTNHQLFQAGSGKFLLQSLMNGAENFFLMTLEKLRPEVQVPLDKRASQWVALAQLNSLEESFAT